MLWMVVASAVLVAQSRGLPSPEATFGFTPGADY
jgi:hypothetical protein